MLRPPVAPPRFPRRNPILGSRAQPRPRPEDDRGRTGWPGFHSVWVPSLVGGGARGAPEIPSSTSAPPWRPQQGPFPSEARGRKLSALLVTAAACSQPVGFPRRCPSIPFAESTPLSRSRPAPGQLVSRAPRVPAASGRGERAPVTLVHGGEFRRPRGTHLHRPRRAKGRTADSAAA